MVSVQAQSGEVVISVVEDDESVRSSLRRLLRSMGFQVMTFPSALEFLRLGPLQDRGCAIVDVRMPEMDGLDLQKRLLQADVGLPIIFITAYEDNGVCARAMRNGAVAFLQKPFDEASLGDAISTALCRSNPKKPAGGEMVGGG